MGGSVGTAFRFANGEVACLELWTNVLPAFLKSKNIIVDKNEDVVRNFIKDEVENENLDIPLAPFDYGLIVIDFQKNVFLTMQGYATFNSFSSVDATGTKNLMELAEAGRIECVRSIYEGTKKIDHHAIMIESREQAKQAIDLARQTVESNPFSIKNWYNFNIIFEPTMEFHEFQETADGAKKFRQKLIDLDFKLDDEANTSWDDFISEYEEYDVF